MSKFKRNVQAAVQKTAGHITEVAGQVLHRPDLEQRGATQVAAGKAQEALGEAGDRIQEKVERAKAVALENITNAAARILPEAAPAQPNSKTAEHSQKNNIKL
jgi:uncharacterized protein YjbJ (UPF0337 family)